MAMHHKTGGMTFVLFLFFCCQPCKIILQLKRITFKSFRCCRGFFWLGLLFAGTFSSCGCSVVLENICNLNYNLSCSIVSVCCGISAIGCLGSSNG